MKTAIGLRPYVMIYEKWTLPARDDLKIFQNWVNTYNCYVNPTREGFEEYRIYYLSPFKSKKMELCSEEQTDLAEDISYENSDSEAPTEKIVQANLFECIA